MEKRHGINTAFRLAAAFFVIKFVLDMLILCCEPLQKLFRTMFYSGILTDQKLSGIAIIISAVSLLIALLPKCILAFYNLGKKDMQKQRGLITIILTAVFSLLSSVFSYAASLIISITTSANEVALISSLSIPRTVTGLLSTAATIILYCCGAIELYNGAEKPTYPPYNGENINTEDTLS
ncbi:hypothetical protein [Ruminococcus flavefaciens]|uniref:hypothetical protein n=1 Tax=Ruminococcus flavefaciens TaxID=1265 RepID=UPI0013DC1F1C|nr:hypothetical protein [Ruminococcus flavefaciens]